MNLLALALATALVMGQGVAATLEPLGSETAVSLCQEAARVVNAGELDASLKLAHDDMDWTFPDGSAHKLQTQRNGDGSCPSTYLVETMGKWQRIKWKAMFLDEQSDRKLDGYFNLHYVGNLLSEPVVLSQGLREVNRGYLLSSFRTGKLDPLCELKPYRADAPRTLVKSDDSGLCAAIEKGRLPLMKWIPTSAPLMQAPAPPGAGRVAPETLQVTIDGKPESLVVGRFDSSAGQCPSDGHYLKPLDTTTHREQSPGTPIPWREEYGSGNDGFVGYKQDNDLPGFVEYRKRNYLLQSDLNDPGHLLVLPLAIPTHAAICELRLLQVHPVMTKEQSQKTTNTQGY
jgi:hypothetical protein